MLRSDDRILFFPLTLLFFFFGLVSALLAFDLFFSDRLFFFL